MKRKENKCNHFDIRLIPLCKGKETRDISKAVAFAFVFKNTFKSSICKDFSYRSLAKQLKKSPNYCKKYITILKEMGKVSIWRHNGHTYLAIGSLKANGKSYRKNRRFNEKICSTIKDFKKTNHAIGVSYIRHTQEGKIFYKNLSYVADGTLKGNRKDILHLKRRQNFSGGNINPDMGLSYLTISKKLGIGNNSAKQIISLGEKKRIFFVQRRVQKFGVDINNVDCLNIFFTHKATFIGKTDIYKIHSNAFLLRGHNTCYLRAFRKLREEIAREYI